MLFLFLLLLLIQICTSLRGLYLVNELTAMAEVFQESAQQQMEGLKNYDDIS